jgi:hypothetical protein
MRILSLIILLILVIDYLIFTSMTIIYPAPLLFSFSYLSGLVSLLLCAICCIIAKRSASPKRRLVIIVLLVIAILLSFYIIFYISKDIAIGIFS